MKKKLLMKPRMIRYNNVNLILNRVHYEFAICLMCELENEFSSNDMLLRKEIKQRFHVKTENFDALTPHIDSLSIRILGIGEIVLHAVNDGICLFNLNIENSCRRNGYGRKIMSIMNQLSTKHNLPIYLTPVDYEHEVGLENLEGFYASCGFNSIPQSLYWNNKNQLNYRIAC